MQNPGSRLAVLFLLFAAGCHGISVHATHDSEVDFTKLHTFDWLPVTPEAHTAVTDATLLAMIGTELEGKGLRRETQPDLFVAVHRAVEGRLNTKGSGYEFRDGRFQSYELQSGTLVVDLVLASTRNVVWRGTAEGAFRADATPQEREHGLTGILHDMFASYPTVR